MKRLYSNVGLMALPTQPEHLVNKAFVENLVAKKIKDPVRVVTDADLNSTYADGKLTQTVGAEFVIDGVTLRTDDRVLVANQVDRTQNGIYIVETLGQAETSEGTGDDIKGVLKRSEDFDSSADAVLNVMIPVQEGDTNHDTTWVLQNDVTVVLDTDALVFAKFRGAEGALVFAVTIEGNDTDKEFIVNHGLNSEKVAVNIYDATTKEQCIFNVEITSANVVTIKSDVVLQNGEDFIVVITG